MNKRREEKAKKYCKVGNSRGLEAKQERAKNGRRRVAPSCVIQSQVYITAKNGSIEDYSMTKGISHCNSGYWMSIPWLIDCIWSFVTQGRIKRNILGNIHALWWRNCTFTRSTGGEWVSWASMATATFILDSQRWFIDSRAPDSFWYTILQMIVWNLPRLEIEHYIARMIKYPPSDGI